MKADTTPNNSSRLQRKISDISSLEATFVKLKIDNRPTELVENKLKELNLEDEKGKLIERGPITSKDTKLPNSKPYQKVTENVYVRHSCGGTAFCIRDTSQQNQDNINDSSINKHFEANNCQHINSDYHPLLGCDRCILEEAYTPAFEKYVLLKLQHVSEEETQLNITNINRTWSSDHINESSTNFKTHPELINSSVRRISHDSGFQSDNPSPYSDYVLSPKPSFILQPSTTETMKSFRKILPKATETQKNEQNITKAIPKANNNETKQKNTQSATEISAKELLRSTLNAEIKQVKWIELVVEKSNDELFETSNCEQTILHKVLQSDEKYIAESLYAIVEKMKMNPDRCSCILASQSSICEAIKQNKHPQLWLDYFCEAMQIIQHKMEAKPTRN